MAFEQRNLPVDPESRRAVSLRRSHAWPSFLKLALISCSLSVGLGCKPVASFGDGPPQIDEHTLELARFDPGALAEPGSGGLEPGAGGVENGPPAAPEPPEPPALPAPELVDYAPRGEISEYPTIQLRFNRAMVPLGEKDRISAEEAGFSFSPPIAGEAYWAEPTRLVFEPKGALPPATDFHAEFHGHLSSIDGPELAVDLDWEFGTESPRINLAAAYSDQMHRGLHHWDARVEVHASQPVALAELRAHTRALAWGGGLEGKAVPISITERRISGHQRAVEFEIQPKQHWPADAEILIEIDKDLVGKTGPRAMGQVASVSFNTAEGVELEPLECRGYDYDDGCDLGPISLSFSAGIARSELQHIRLEPKPKGFERVAINQLRDRRGRARDAYAGVMLWGDLQRGQTYTVHIDPKLEDIHGQPLTGATTDEIHFVEPPPTLMLSKSSGIFVQTIGALLGIESRHAERLHLRTAVLDPAHLEAAYGHALTHWPSDVVGQDELISVQPSGAWGWSAIEHDMSVYTKGKPGAVLVEVSVDTLAARAQGRARPEPRLALIQISDLGVTAHSSLPGGVVRVARLANDSPVANAAIELIDDIGGTRVELGKTDSEGLLRVPGAAELDTNELLRVSKGTDHIYVNVEHLWRARSEATESSLRDNEQVVTTLMSERPLYKPGERVRAMGWASLSTPYALSGLGPLPAKTQVELELRDHRDELVASRTVYAKDHGKYWATLDIPATAALGTYELRATLWGHSARTTLRVEDFATPEFEVQASLGHADLIAGSETEVRVDASYLFGGRVPIIRARSSTNCTDVDYRPPGLDPSWDHAPQLGLLRGGLTTYPRPVKLGPEAAKGHLDYDLVPHPATLTNARHCTHSIALADATQREMGAEATVLVHPQFYLATRRSGETIEGEDLAIEVATMDFAGVSREVDTVTVRLERSWSEPRFAGKRSRELVDWKQRSRKLPVCEIKASSAGSCDFKALEHGSYTVEIVARAGELEVRHEDWFWVREVAPANWNRGPTEALKIELALERPGETVGRVGERVTAKIRAPWSTGGGMLMLVKGGIHQVEAFRFEQGQADLDLEITDAWIPGVELHVVAVEPGSSTRLPRLRQDDASLHIDQGPRELAVRVEVPAEAQTRERIPIDVVVRDHLGAPAAGHVSVWAVDEAVLALEPLVLPDFVGNFVVASGWSRLGSANNYRDLQLPYRARADSYSPWVYSPWGRGGGVEGGILGGLSGTGSGGGGYGAGGLGVGHVGTLGGGGGSMPAARSKFSSAPIFIGDAEVGADGHVRLHGELPDNLTTFRVTAVVSGPLAADARSAVGGAEARFGTGDARVRVTRPLVVRAAMPRVLRPGDQAELGVIVDNLRAGAGQVEVEVVLRDGEGRVELLGAATAKAALGASDQLRLPFALRAIGVGEATVELRARLREPSGVIHEDALHLPLPVEPERTSTERVAVYGSLDSEGAAVLPFVLPADADPRFGGLSVSVGSTLLGELEDALAYLVTYPHGCVEQSASALLPLVPLGRLARQGYPLGVPDVDDHVRRGIVRLRSMQLEGGGFGYWPGSSTPVPYASAYATWVLGRAERAGYRVPAAMLADANTYLLGLVEVWGQRRAPEVGEDIEIAQILWTLGERQRAPQDALTRLFERRQRLPVFAQATLVLALESQVEGIDLDLQRERVEIMLGELKSMVDEREAVAKVETPTRWTWYWDSDARSTALVLMAMLRSTPDHPLVTKLARGLLEARRGGRWSNTQENAYALVALADYAGVYEADTPDFEARVWHGQSLLTSVSVQGRSFDLQEGFTPMASLLDSREAAASPVDRLLLQRAGVGRMYYRVGLEWASTAVDKPAAAEGIRIARVIRRETGLLEPDTAVSAGELLAIDVEIEIPAALDHVAIEVPVPAGIETVNLDLGKGTAAMKLQGKRGYWVSHQELRRDRAVLYADHLEPGVYTTTVFTRATTPGDYQMPAASAEMMYYPEVYGRTKARRLVVH